MVTQKIEVDSVGWLYVGSNYQTQGQIGLYVRNFSNHTNTKCVVQYVIFGS